MAEPPHSPTKLSERIAVRSGSVVRERKKSFVDASGLLSVTTLTRVGSEKARSISVGRKRNNVNALAPEMKIKEVCDTSCTGGSSVLDLANSGTKR
jgi:hypothetical protein